MRVGKWQTSDSSLMQDFADRASQITGKNLSEWPELYEWSCSHPAEFWSLVAKDSGVLWRIAPQEPYIKHNSSKFYDVEWFPDAKLNFAENLLRFSDEKDILIAHSETGTEVLSGKKVKAMVGSIARGMLAEGVEPGDVVSGVLVNGAEAILLMLATTAIGATWSSCSPDFGEKGVLDRLRQVKPKLLFYSREYSYGGKTFDCGTTAASVAQAIGAKVFTVGSKNTLGDPGTFEDWLNTYTMIPLSASEFFEAPFDHPVYILFSSGTTGVPKCIVHGAGRTLLQHQKELRLHCGLREEDRLLYFTTCGWMMWNWMVSALATGTTVVCYDGSPGYPDLGALWRVVEDYEVTVLGTSPKFLGTCQSLKWTAEGLNFRDLRLILSTGAPLLPEHQKWVHEHIKTDLPVASISGGTDIISCFMLGNPMLPLEAGRIQSPGLGMAIECWNQDGNAVVEEQGELVCVQPFLSMPLFFLNDPEGKKFWDAYFSHFDNIWRHGDFVTMHIDGSITVHGRSDATLNPGGVRIGTAEIYGVVENFDGVKDSLAIALPNFEGDVDICLFVVFTDDTPELSESAAKSLKAKIREELTPRHVPRYIFSVQEVPYTRSGKKVEMAVTKLMQGKEPENLGAIGNVESLAGYRTIYQENFL